MKYYKLLDENHRGHYSNFKWDLSGKWMSVKGKLELRINGFHILRVEDIVYWLNCGFNLYEVKIKGDKIIDNTKVCVRSVRVVKKIDNYNKDNLLETVINPAVERAKHYATDAAYAAAADAAATAAAYAAAADAAAYAATYATCAAYAAAAAAAASGDGVAAVVAAGDAEKAKQTKDLEKLLK